MNAAVIQFYQTYKYGVPFLALFLASLVLPTASHRILFYLLLPLFFGILYDFRHEIKEYAKTRSFAFMALYLGYFLLSSLWSLQADLSEFLKEIRTVLAISVFTLSLAIAIPKIEWPPRLPIYFAGICLAASVVYAAVYYLPGQLSLDSRMEGLGRYKNSIHYAFLLSYAVIALLCLGFVHCKKQLSLRALLIFALLIFIALSQTRSAFVSLGVCIVLFGFLGHLRIALALGVLVAVAAGVSYYVWDYAFENLFHRFDSYRFQIWKDAYEGILQKKWFGHGILTEPFFFPETTDVKHGWKSTHNTLLGHAYTGGGAGLAIYLGMIANMAWVATQRFFREKKNKRNYTYLTLLSCLMICYALCASMFNFSHYIVNVHIQWLVFWVPFAMTWYIEVSEKRRLEAAGDVKAY